MSIRQEIVEAGKREKAAQSLQQPIRGVVNRPLPDYEGVAVTGAYQPGISKYYIRHPYMGVNSWIRVMPEAGTEVLTQRRGDRLGEEVVGYLSTGRDKSIQLAKEGKLLYRVLDSGEMEFMSSGRAYVHLSDAGDIEMRGGLVQQDLLQSDMEHSAYAPTYVRRLHRHDAIKKSNEERFGVVKRRPYSNDLADRYVRLPSNEFAVEYRRQLTDENDKRMITLAEGHVISGTGKIVKSPLTQQPLRYAKAVYIKNESSNAERVLHYIDAKANVVYINGVSHAVSTLADIGKKGSLHVKGQTFRMSFTGNSITKVGGAFNVTAKGSIDIEAGKFEIATYTAGMIQVHSNAIFIGGGPATDSVYFPALNSITMDSMFYNPVSTAGVVVTQQLNTLAITLAALASALSIDPGVSLGTQQAALGMLTSLDKLWEATTAASTLYSTALTAVIVSKSTRVLIGM